MLAASADAIHTSFATVLELSSLSLRAGCAGELDPQVELPTAVGVASSALPLPNRKSGFRFPLNPLELLQDTDIVNPLEYDTSTHAYKVKDPDALSFALDFLLGQSGAQYYAKETPIEHPLLIAEPACADAAYREALSQIIFESLNGIGLAFYKQPALAVFGCGRVSGLVWDSGYSQTTASVVTEGYTLPKSVVHHSYAGHAISAAIRTCLHRSEPVKGSHTTELPAPAFAYDSETGNAPTRRPFIMDSYWNWGIDAIIENLKRQRCSFKTKQTLERPNPIYSLPDHTKIDTRSFATDVLEPLMAGGSVQLGTAGQEAVIEGCIEQLTKSLTLPELRSKSRDIVDVVLLVGGGSCFPGCIERYQEDLATSASSTLLSDYKLIAPTDLTVRRHASFVGGSIFACLSSFETYVVPKSDYDDHGPNIFARRCP